MRKNLIRNVKTVKLTADILNNNWPKEKVFVNERITNFKRNLFSQTRSVAKEKNYKFVWLSNADILIRKNENSKIKKIKTSQDIVASHSCCHLIIVSFRASLSACALFAALCAMVRSFASRVMGDIDASKIALVTL